MAPSTEVNGAETEDAPQYDTVPALTSSQFCDAVESYLSNKQLADQFAAAAEADKQLIEHLVRKAEAPKTVVYKNARITQTEGRKGNSKVDPKLLLKLGVDPDLVVKATVAGEPGKPGLRISFDKET